MFIPKLGAWGACGLGELGWWWPGSRHTGTSCLQNRAMWVLAGEMPAAGTGEMLSSLGFTYICVCKPIYMYIYLCTCISAKGVTQNTAAANTLKLCTAVLQALRCICSLIMDLPGQSRASDINSQLNK